MKQPISICPQLMVASPVHEASLWRWEPLLVHDGDVPWVLIHIFLAPKICKLSKRVKRWQARTSANHHYASVLTRPYQGILWHTHICGTNRLFLLLLLVCQWSRNLIQRVEAGRSGPWSFLEDCEEARGTHKRKKEGPKDMYGLFVCLSRRRWRSGLVIIPPLLRGFLRLISIIFTSWVSFFK